MSTVLNRGDAEAQSETPRTDEEVRLESELNQAKRTISILEHANRGLSEQLNSLRLRVSAVKGPQ